MHLLLEVDLGGTLPSSCLCWATAIPIGGHLPSEVFIPGVPLPWRLGGSWEELIIFLLEEEDDDDWDLEAKGA